ncbi:MAG: hypothetical protein JNL60_12700 [Bacteroidia bacterium]|nr:hypothetical protein [Bacteroidia bacterium]
MNIFFMRSQDNAEQKIARTDVKKYYMAQKKAPLSVNGAHVAYLHYEALVLGVSVGRSLPIGKFASRDLNEDNSGCALNGYMLNANAALKIMDEFGFTVSYVYQFNRFDESAIAKAFNSAYPAGGFTSNATAWKMRGSFFGFVINLSIKKIPGLSVKTEVKGGFPLFYQPEISTSGTISGQFISIDSEARPTRAPAFNGSVGLTYKFMRNIAFTADLDFFSAKPFFVGRHITPSGYVQGYSYMQPYRTMTPRAGICFFLWHRKVE